MRDAQDAASHRSSLTFSSPSEDGDSSFFGDLPEESPLSLAARRGDTERVKQLLEDPDVDLNAVDYWSSTPLTYAARNCHIDIVRMMVKDKNRIDAKNYKNAFFAAAAAEEGVDSVPVLELLFATFNIDVNATDMNESTALHLATQKRNRDAVEFLLKKNGIDINKKDKSGSTALDIGLAKGGRHVVELLLPSAWDKNLENSIEAAVRSGNDDRLHSLLASCCASVNDHLEPLSWAAMRGQLKVLQILLTRNGANANARDRSERTAISWAAQAGQADAVDLLLKHGADANLPDRYGSTPLWYALRENEEEIAKKLIPLDTKALAMLVIENKPDLIKVIMRLGTDPDHKDADGRTALHIAAYLGRLDCAKTLLSAGADINAVEYSGKTPLQVVLFHRRADFARELLKRRASTTGVMPKEWYRVSGKRDGEFAVLSETYDGERHLDFPEAIDDCRTLCKEYPQRKNFLIPLTDETNGSVWAKVLFKVSEEEKLTANDLRIYQASEVRNDTVSITLWLPLDQFSSDRLSQHHGAQVSRIGWYRSYFINMGNQTAYLSTLPFGCIPDDCADLFRLFLKHANTQWLELCRRAGECLSKRRVDQLTFRGKSPHMMDDLAKDAQKLANLRLCLANHISQARVFLDEPKMTVHSSYSTRNTVLKMLEEDFETGIKTKLNELDQIARDLLQIEFAWSSIREARTATKLGQNVMLLTYVSIFYLPLGFCAALWAIPNITDISTRLPFIITACCVSLLTLLVTFNMERIATWFQEGHRYCRTKTPSEVLGKISTNLPKKVPRALLKAPRELLGKISQWKEKKKVGNPSLP